jgi:hypothetical protein
LAVQTGCGSHIETPWPKIHFSQRFDRLATNRLRYFAFQKKSGFPNTVDTTNVIQYSFAGILPLVGEMGFVKRNRLPAISYFALQQPA